jgi:hypothetical protein
MNAAAAGVFALLQYIRPVLSSRGCVRTWRLCVTLLLAAALGCARRTPSDSDRRPSGASRGSDVITAAELSDPSVASGDALEAVRRLRPRFLASRGAQSIRIAGAGQVHLSIDGGPLQAIGNLSRMRPSELSEIRYLNSTDAAQQFGTAAGSGGVILVRSR